VRNPFRYFKTSPDIIRLAVMMYIRYPLPLRQVEDLLHERGIDICHETVRAWWTRFGPMFAARKSERSGRHPCGARRPGRVAPFDAIKARALGVEVRFH